VALLCLTSRVLSCCLPVSNPSATLVAGKTYDLQFYSPTYGWTYEGQIPIGIDPYGFRFTSSQSSATTWTFAVSATASLASYDGYGYTATGIQGVLSGPNGALNADYGGVEFVRLQDSTYSTAPWNFGLAFNTETAPNVAPIVVQINELINGYNYGYALGAIDDNGDYTLAINFGNSPTPLQVYQCLTTL